jgi:hypothetical protein
MVQVHGRRVSKRLHHLQSRVVFIVVVVVVVVWRRARHFVGRREREIEWGDRKTFEIQTLLQFALAFFSLLLFTFHQRKKRVVVVESLFVEVLFRSLFVCARDFTSSPGVCDATLKREINFKQKKNVIWRELRSTREKEEQKKESFLEG